MILTIQSATRTIVDGAKVAMDLRGLSAADALDCAAEYAIQDGRDACARTGAWRTESTAEQIEAATFQAAVARDILNGTVSRPSTGNVRDYALALLNR